MRVAPEPRPAPKEPALRAPARPPLLPTGLGYVIKSALSILSLVVLAAATAVIFIYQRRARGVEGGVPRLAERYLTALASADYATAYDFLSPKAQARCSKQEYRRLRGEGVWTIKDVKLAKLEADAAVVSYAWSVEGRAPVTIYLPFELVAGRWLVPFNLNLLRGVEDAVRRNDPDLALLDSQEAVRVAPRDPIARASSCEAAFFRKLYDQAVPECRAALALAAEYPSNISAQRLEHVRALNALLEKGSKYVQ